jgi:hypothetical protein
MKCPCPVRCNYCGAKRRRDPVGHYCPTKNCQWEHGYSTCTLNKPDEDVTMESNPAIPSSDIGGEPRPRTVDEIRRRATYSAKHWHTPMEALLANDVLQLLAAAERTEAAEWIAFADELPTNSPDAMTPVYVELWTTSQTLAKGFRLNGMMDGESWHRPREYGGFTHWRRIIGPLAAKNVGTGGAGEKVTG